MIKKIKKALIADLSLNDNNIYYIFLMGLIVGLFILVSFFYAPFVYVALAVAGIFIAIIPGIQKLYLLIFLLPFYNVLKTNLDGFVLSSWLMFLTIAMVGIRYIIDIIKRKKKLNWVVSILFIVLIGFLFLPRAETNWFYVLKLTFTFLILYLTFCYREDLDFKSLVFSLLFGHLYAVLFVPFRFISPRLDSFLSNYDAYVGNMKRFSGLVFDPNYYAIEILIALTLLTQLFYTKKINLTFYPLFTIFSVLGILTISKAFFLAYCVFILIIAVLFIRQLCKNKKKFNIKKFLIIFGCLILGLVILWPFIYSVIKRFTSKSIVEFGDDSNELLNGITTGRSVLWKYYLIDIFSNFQGLIMGHGTGSLVEVPNFGRMSVHNTFIECLYFLGLIGCGIALAIMIYMFIKSSTKKNRKVINFVPLCCTLIILMGLNTLNSYRAFIVIILLAYSINFNAFDDVIPNTDWNKRLSIIIPVYKVEKFLEQCVQSIISLNYKNLEIILIDDCSPDNSGKICDQLAKKDSRIIVEHLKKNGGVSNARNEGLKLAKGDYVTFIDSDDFITSDFINCLQSIEDEDVIIYASFINEQDSLNIPNLNWTNRKQKNLLGGKIGNNTYNCVWNKVYKRDLLITNDLKFDKDLVIAEDLKFNVDVYKFATNISFVGIGYYVYKINPNSVMQNITYKKISDTLKTCKYCIDVANEINDKNKKKFLIKLASENLLSVVNNAGKFKDDERDYLINELQNLKKNIVYGSTIKKKIVVILLKIIGIKRVCKLLTKDK